MHFHTMPEEKRLMLRLHGHFTPDFATVSKRFRPGTSQSQPTNSVILAICKTMGINQLPQHNMFVRNAKSRKECSHFKS